MSQEWTSQTWPSTLFHTHALVFLSLPVSNSHMQTISLVKYPVNLLVAKTKFSTTIPSVPPIIIF